MELKIFQVDAFTSKPFGGNPAAIVPLAEWLPDETMQSIALENNLSETAFFVKENDGYGLCWFTPTDEVDLCGHATLASAYVLFNILKVGESSLKFRTKSGELRVERDADRLVLDFPVRLAVETEPPNGFIQALGSNPEKVLKSRAYLAVYGTEDEVLSLEPDFRALSKLDAYGVIVTAPGKTCDFVSRFFAPAVGVDEDPVTGSAHCTLIPYWAERLAKTELFARQVSARGGELFCELAGDRVKIGGHATLFLKGEIYIDEAALATAGA